MIETKILILMLFLHWFADFRLQTEEMAEKKSECGTQLFYHCSIYALVFLPFGITFSVWLFITHVLIDGTSSRITARLWEEKKIRTFFNVIGFDQFLHILVLIFCYDMFYKIDGGLI